MENNNKWYKNELVEGCHPSTYLKKHLNIFLWNKKYSDILYIALEKSFIYRKECDKIISCDSRHYLINLISKGIIEEIKLPEDIIEILKVTKKLGKYHLNKLTTYSLTSEARSLLSLGSLSELLIENTTEHAKNYTKELTELYYNNLEDIQIRQRQDRINHILNLRKLGVQIPFEDKVWFENILGRKLK